MKFSRILLVFLVALVHLAFTSCSLFSIDTGPGTSTAIGKVGDGVSNVGDGLGKIGDSIHNANLSPFPPSPTSTLTTKPILSQDGDTLVVSKEFVVNSIKNHKWKEAVLKWKEKNLVE